jgi:hypothetical protein
MRITVSTETPTQRTEGFFYIKKSTIKLNTEFKLPNKRRANKVELHDLD